MSDITGRSLPFKMKMHLRQMGLPRFAAMNRRRRKNSHFIQLQIKNRMLHGLGLKLKAREKELAAERERADKAEKARLVPGEMRCAKCNFGLIRTNLYVNNGTTGPGSNETEPCPNGCGPLWPETWEHSAREAWSRLETMHAELAALRADAARDVLVERRRQIEAEGWTPEHDDEHDNGEMADAAACYAACSETHSAKGHPPLSWPWSPDWWKPSADPRRNLVKAGALILAEIERLDRAAMERDA